ncbi:MAG: gluconokinase [Actinomycetota bacterium]|nr:gluconokinase [Actinomycetota bacterium]
MIVVVMGVTGSGKSSIGRPLASALRVPFIEGDDFHDPADVEKMRRGVSLTAEDRAPWLDRLNGELRRHGSAGAVLACSALTEQSRERLVAGVADVRFVFLHGDEAVLRSRLDARRDHFAPSSLVTSQLDTLEEPDDAVKVDVTSPHDAIVADVLNALSSGEHPALG